jgi:hypothetical protein
MKSHCATLFVWSRFRCAVHFVSRLDDPTPYPQNSSPRLGESSRGSGLSDEAAPAAPANDCHGSGGSGSTKDGGSSDQVASEDLDGSAAELIKAKKAAMERFKKNGGSKSSAA